MVILSSSLLCPWKSTSTRGGQPQLEVISQAVTEGLWTKFAADACKTTCILCVAGPGLEKSTYDHLNFAEPIFADSCEPDPVLGGKLESLYKGAVQFYSSHYVHALYHVMRL